MAAQTPADDPRTLRATFDAAAPLTVGIEEELMLLDPATLDLAPVAPRVLEQLDGDERFKLELPAAQLEIALPPARSVPPSRRAQLAARAPRRWPPRPTGSRARRRRRPPVRRAPRASSTPASATSTIEREYGAVARRQLVFALQVHVAVGGADRALAVYNALRAHLPDLAALAANAPFHGGRDTGLASIRPKIVPTCCRARASRPRSDLGGVRRGAALGRARRAIAGAGRWWWELRPHPAFGTLEVRVPDAQATVADAAARGRRRPRAGRLARRAPRRRRAAARADTGGSRRTAGRRARHGLDGSSPTSRTGEREPARERLDALLDELEPVAGGSAAPPSSRVARALVERNGADRQRERRRAGDPRGAARVARRRLRARLPCAGCVDG